MAKSDDVKKELQVHASAEKAKILSKFFKTGNGEYGEGDVFLGITVPEQRKIAKKYKNLELRDIQKLLESKIHEHRLVALLILAGQFQKKEKKQEIFEFYLKNTKKINNWDLVDLTADKIVGEYLFDKEKTILTKLANSENLWERRIAIMATFHFIKKGEHEWTFKLAEVLLNDKHDLIHKVVGWMLREVGKRIGQDIEEKFLKKHYRKMPRTMLRYAIERFDERKREFFLNRL